MTYKINGTAITLQPTDGAWQKRSILGLDGNAHPIYPAYREYEMTWKLTEESDLNQLQGFFDTMVITGSAVVELPEYASSAYQFKAYTGCIVYEPTFQEYFAEHVTSVVLVITHIKT
jgi:hypothetical protein